MRSSEIAPTQGQNAAVPASAQVSPPEPRPEVEEPPTRQAPALPATPSLPVAMTANERRPEPAVRLSDERALIDSARQALVRDEPDAALSTLRRHRRTYALGALREERDALEVVALAQAGRTADAERLGRRFHARYPASLLGGTVRAALAGLPPEEDAREDLHENSDDE